MQENLIKKTKSLSPISNREIEADVIKKGRKVYLKKQDEEGNQYTSLIEPDYDFYTWMTSKKVDKQVDLNGVLMYVSNRCNLNCPLCYEYGNTADEPSLDEITRVLSKYKLVNVVLMGREPTCREDIFEIIRIAAKHNRSSLLTNGLKLSDYDYVYRLKEAGLGSVTFSFNGFNDDIYREMNGRPLLDIKLKALENIKRVGIKTILSVTLNRGVNEQEVQRIIDYCFDNLSFITELRIRTASRVGSHLDVEPFCMSDLIDLISRSISIPKQDLYKEQLFWNEFSSELAQLVPHTLKTFTQPRLCCFYFHINKTNRGYTSFAPDLDMDSIRRSPMKKARLAFELLRAYGIHNMMYSAGSYLIPRFITEHNLADILTPKSQRLFIVLRSWPNIYNIDLEENKKCPSQYYKAGEFLPFCYANIMTDEVRNKDQTTCPQQQKTRQKEPISPVSPELQLR